MADEEARGRQTGERDVDASESTPLLPPDQTDTIDQSQPQRQTSARRSLLSSLNSTGKGDKRRWPSLVALLALCVVVILIIVFAFMAPSTVEQYAQEAVVFEPTSLSIDSFTASGVRARIQGEFMMDAGRVRRKPVRDLGRFFTSIAKEAESGQSEVEVSLPEYGNVVLGTAHVPGIKVDLRNGHSTHVDFLSDLEPGDVDGIRRIANDWIDGRLGQLRVLGKAKVPLKSGIVNLGKQLVEQELLFANKDIPSIPAYKIKKLNFREMELPNGDTGMAADASLQVYNEYPVDFTVPPLAFAILVDNCKKDEPFIKLADAETHELSVQPKQQVELNVTALVHELPDILTQDCPDSKKSPLDVILGKYLHGEETTLYVRGADAPQLNTPKWITDLMADITVPVPLPGKTFGQLIKNFSLTDTHFSLPDPFADPNSPEANPQINANVQALIALPEEMNFNISVSRVRADADVFYKKKRLGKLDLHQWQKANSTRRESQSEEDGPELIVQSAVQDAPLRITDNDVFTDVIEALMFGGKGVVLGIKADVDVQVTTALGEVVVRRIPAEGAVPVKAINGEGVTFTPPTVFDLEVLETSPTSLSISALINLTNPTDYTATIPYIDLEIYTNSTLLGHATAHNLSLTRGSNTHLPISGTFTNTSPLAAEFLSQYISGYNTTLTLALHPHSIPALPGLGKGLNLTLPTPALPGIANAGFIHDATFHLLTSTADFLLLSPVPITVTHVNATAYYHDDVVGRIVYDEPFDVAKGGGEDGEGERSPRLPVEWSLGSVGYEAVKGALGGTLKVGAVAQVGVQIGRWGVEVWFRGSGIGAGVRL